MQVEGNHCQYHIWENNRDFLYFRIVFRYLRAILYLVTNHLENQIEREAKRIMTTGQWPKWAVVWILVSNKKVYCHWFWFKDPFLHWYWTISIRNLLLELDLLIIFLMIRKIHKSMSHAAWPQQGRSGSFPWTVTPDHIW